MHTQALIENLEMEWEQPHGFLGRLRTGIYEEVGFARLVGTLQSIPVEKGDMLNHRLVSLTWYIPIFMSWQRERVREKGGDAMAVDRAINKIQSVLEAILGVP